MAEGGKSGGCTCSCNDGRTYAVFALDVPPASPAFLGTAAKFTRANRRCECSAAQTFPTVRKFPGEHALKQLKTGQTATGRGAVPTLPIDL